MEKKTYVMLIERGDNYSRINQVLVNKHVEYIRKLDEAGNLVVAGTTKGFSGVAGMIVFRADSDKEAKLFCKNEPFVAAGYATFKFFSMRVGNKENNYLLKQSVEE